MKLNRVVNKPPSVRKMQKHERKQHYSPDQQVDQLLDLQSNECIISVMCAYKNEWSMYANQNYYVIKS